MISPPNSRTSAIRWLHAVAARRGFDHEDLRVLLDVESLALATTSAIQQLARDLQEDHPRPHARRARLRPGVIRPATAGQRQLLAQLVAELGQIWPADKLQRFLVARCEIVDVQRGSYTTVLANRAIGQLINIRRVELRRTMETLHA